MSKRSIPQWPRRIYLNKPRALVLRSALDAEVVSLLGLLEEDKGTEFEAETRKKLSAARALRGLLYVRSPEALSSNDGLEVQKGTLPHES